MSEFWDNLRKEGQARMEERQATLARFPKLKAILDEIDVESRSGVLAVIDGPYPSAEELSAHLTRLGHPVSASSIRTYRRSFARQERAS